MTDAVGPEIVGLELALDAGRPRRVSIAEPHDCLGRIAERRRRARARPTLAIRSSGLGLRPSPPARFGWTARGQGASLLHRQDVGRGARPSGAVWLRRPEGSYNGAKSSEAVTFDAFVFSALGAELETPCTITLESSAVSGQLRLASPFLLRDVPSGVYEVSASASAAATRTTFFTVNRELVGGS